MARTRNCETVLERCLKRKPTAQARESSDKPILNAFCRVAPSVRFSVLAMRDAVFFCWAIVLKVRTCSAVQARRFVAFLAIEYLPVLKNTCRRHLHDPGVSRAQVNPASATPRLRPLGSRICFEISGAPIYLVNGEDSRQSQPPSHCTSGVFDWQRGQTSGLSTQSALTSIHRTEIC